MFVLSRFLRALFTLWLIVTVVFIATRLTGDPTQALIPPDLPEANREELRVKLGLDQDILTQYWSYAQIVVTGDFGLSFFSQRPVTELFAERLPNTLILTIPALVLSIVLGIPIGVIAALRHNTTVDRSLIALSVTGQAIPSFVLGIGLILIFSLWLRMLPSGGMSSWKSIILPVITLGLATAANVARLMRSSMLEVLSQEYIRFAHSKGLSPSTVVIKHGLRNALLPVLTIVGLQVGYLIGGSVVTESVFAWPGAGRLLIEAVMRRDFALLQFGVMMFAAAVIIANFLVDLGYGLLDPRVRGSLS